jgi:hypothetical protein
MIAKESYGNLHVRQTYTIREIVDTFNKEGPGHVARFRCLTRMDDTQLDTLVFGNGTPELVSVDGEATMTGQALGNIINGIPAYPGDDSGLLVQPKSLTKADDNSPVFLVFTPHQNPNHDREYVYRGKASGVRTR